MNEDNKIILIIYRHNYSVIVLGGSFVFWGFFHKKVKRICSFLMSPSPFFVCSLFTKCSHFTTRIQWVEEGNALKNILKNWYFQIFEYFIFLQAWNKASGAAENGRRNAISSCTGTTEPGLMRVNTELSSLISIGRSKSGSHSFLLDTRQSQTTPSPSLDGWCARPDEAELILSLQMHKA